MSGCAWVTLATNDSYSLGALVLGHSLKKSNTAHKLAVLVTPGVSQGMRDQLQGTFDLVKCVDVLDSRDEAHLALMKRPELGVTFTKIHCWTLTEFEKCVFLDADTLVVRNCDELFEKEEFSAAPDVGWPDCFNSGVFVYRPSVETFKKLLEFAVDEGSFDGGDQGLLNEFFSDWATGDIKKHLPFVYNLTSVAVYSYIPAFKRYGSETRIVHFIGSGKPWLQRLDPVTRSITPCSGSEHLAPLLQKWWDIFCEKVHPSLNKGLEKEPLEADASCDSNPPVDHSHVPEKPRLVEPDTPYREEKDFRQCNLPYLPFDVKGSSGELLNVGFRLHPDDCARTIMGARQLEDRSNDHHAGPSSEGWRDGFFLEGKAPGTAEGPLVVQGQDGHSKSTRVRRPGPVPGSTSNNNKAISQQHATQVEDDRSEKGAASVLPNPEESHSNTPFHFNTFFPDDKCVNNYLEQNVLRYQPFHSQKAVAVACPPEPIQPDLCHEETQSLPRFLTMSEDDKRQSGNCCARTPVKEAVDGPPSTEQAADNLPATFHPVADLQGRQTPNFPLTNAVTAGPVAPFPNSKSTSQLFFDASSVEVYLGSSSWQPCPPADIHRKFSMRKLRPLLPRGTILCKSTPAIFPKVTQYTEFLMSADYRDPVGLPTDKEGFLVHVAVKEGHLKRTKSETSLGEDLAPWLRLGNGRGAFAESDAPPDPSKFHDLNSPKGQRPNRPNCPGINGYWHLPNAAPRKRTTTASQTESQRNKWHRKRTKREGSSARERRKGGTPRPQPINYPPTGRPDNVHEILKRLIGFSNNYLHYFHEFTNKTHNSSTFGKCLHGACKRANADHRDATDETLKLFPGPAQPHDLKHSPNNSSPVKYTTPETTQSQSPVTANGKSQAIKSNLFKTTFPKSFQTLWSIDQCRTIGKGLAGFQCEPEGDKTSRQQRHELNSPRLAGHTSSQTNLFSVHNSLGDSDSDSRQEPTTNTCRALIKYTDVRCWNRKFQAQYRLDSTDRPSKAIAAIPLPWPKLTATGSGPGFSDPPRTNEPPPNPLNFPQRKTESPVAKETPQTPPPRKELSHRRQPSPLPNNAPPDEDVSPEGATTPSASQTFNHGPSQPLSLNKVTHHTTASAAASTPACAPSMTADSRNSFLGYNHRQDASVKYPTDGSSNHRAGITGGIGQMSLDAAESLGNAESSAHQEYLRRQNWETGNIDYMGRDSFDNIWAKICQTLEQKPPQAQSTSPPEIGQIIKPDKSKEKTSLPDSSSQLSHSENQSNVTDVEEAAGEVLTAQSLPAISSVSPLATENLPTAMPEMPRVESGTGAQLPPSTPVVPGAIVPATNFPSSSLPSLPSNPPATLCQTTAHQRPLPPSIASEPSIPTHDSKPESPGSGVLPSCKVPAEQHVGPQPNERAQPQREEKVGCPQAVTSVSSPLEAGVADMSPPSQQAPPFSTPISFETKSPAPVALMAKIEQTRDPEVLSKDEIANNHVAIINTSPTSSQKIPDNSSSPRNQADANWKRKQDLPGPTNTEDKPSAEAHDIAGTDEKATAVVPYCHVFEFVKNPQAPDINALKESHRKLVEEAIKNQAHAKPDQFPPIPMPETPTETKPPVPLNNTPQAPASELPAEGTKEASPNNEGHPKKGLINKILQVVGVTPKGSLETEPSKSTFYDQQPGANQPDAPELKAEHPSTPQLGTMALDPPQTIPAAAPPSPDPNENHQSAKSESKKSHKDPPNQSHKGDKKSSKKNKPSTPKPPPLPEKKRDAKKPQQDIKSDTPSRDITPQSRPTQKNKSNAKQDNQINASPKKPQRPTEANPSGQPPRDAHTPKNKSSTPTPSEPLPSDTIEPQSLNLISAKNPTLFTIDDSSSERPPTNTPTGGITPTPSSTQENLKRQIDPIIDEPKTLAESNLEHHNTAHSPLLTPAPMPQPGQQPNALKLHTPEGKPDATEPLDTHPDSKPQPTKQNQRGGQPEQKLKRPAQKHPPKHPQRHPDDIQQPNLTAEQHPNNPGSDRPSSKLSDQILKAIPPPRRKAISDAKTQAAAVATNAIPEPQPQNQAPVSTKTGGHKPKAPADPVPPPRNRSKPRQNTPPEPNPKK